MTSIPCIAWDVETPLFSPGRMAPPIVVSSFANDSDNWLVPAWEFDHLIIIEDYLQKAATGKLRIVGHNVRFDMCCLMADYPDLIPLVFDAYDAGGVTDTMLRQKLWDIGTGDIKVQNKNSKLVVREYKLGTVAKRLLNVELDKAVEVREGYGELWGVPLGQWSQRKKDYALADSDVLRPIYDMQASADRSMGGKLLVDETRQASHALALQLVHVWGMRTDEKAVAELRERTEAEVHEALFGLRPNGRLAGMLRKKAEKRSVRSGLDEANKGLVACGLADASGSRKTKAAQERILGVFPDCPRTDKAKQPQVNEDTSNDSGDAVLMLLAEYQALQSILSKDCKALANGTSSPMHPYFDSLKTTGRTGSSRDRDSGIGHNAQNWGRKSGARQCHAPREGRMLCACDFSQLELHTLAEVQYSVFGSSVLGEALNRHMDAHLMMAGNVLGMTYEEAEKRKDDPYVDDARQTSKPVNFGLAGGMGAKGLAAYAKANYKMEFTIDKAKWLIVVYHKTWPDMQGYFDWIRAMAGGGNLATIEHLYSGRMRANIPYTVRCNTFFQGLASDAAKAALYALVRACYADTDSVLYRCQCRTINFPHDEVIVEVPANPYLAHLCAMEIRNIMETTANRWIPHCPTQAEPCLMWRWHKKAKPVYKDGMLIPWRPKDELAA